MRLTTLVGILILAGAGMCVGGDKKCSVPQPVSDKKFIPGQVWEYKTRIGEETSFLTILKVESLPKGTIVHIHIRIDKVRLKNCSGGPEPETIEHMPFARDAVDKSVTKLLRVESNIPDFQPGYSDWRNACGGVYTISVADAVQTDEVALNQNLGCQNHR